MFPPVITCQPLVSKILLIGQAPGINEKEHQRPFAWTAGKTLFRWFSSIGVDEQRFRERAYMSALCRCFPGKNPKGGDRKPSPDEIKTCSQWLNAEIQLLQPELILPVGKMAIEKFLSFKLLKDVVGRQHTVTLETGAQVDIIPLPHPSGASTWHVMQPGKTLLADALGTLQKHPLWQEVAR